MAAVQKLTKYAGVLPIYYLSFKASRTRMDPQIAFVFKHFVCLVEEGVQMAYARQCQFVDNQLGMMGLQAFKRVAVVGVDDKGSVVKLLHVRGQPLLGLFDVHPFCGLEYDLQVVIRSEVAFKLGTCLHSLLGEVLGDELLVVLEGYPGLTAFEKAHLRAALTALQTVLISSSVM